MSNLLSLVWQEVIIQKYNKILQDMVLDQMGLVWDLQDRQARRQLSHLLWHHPSRSIRWDHRL